MAPADTDDFVVEIPNDSITIGHDADGLPRTEPGKGSASTPAKTTQVADSSAASDDDRFVKLERERDEASRALEAERARATQAENFAREALARTNRAEEARTVSDDRTLRAHYAKVHSEHQQISSAISNAKQLEQSARQNFIAAREAGDAGREADAMAAMADVKAALAQLETGKIAAENNINEAKRAYESYAADVERAATAVAQQKTKDADSKPQTPEEWVESTKNFLNSEGVEWLRKNREFSTDVKRHRAFLRAAAEFEDDHGVHALKSDAFVEAMNEKFFPAQDDDEIEPVKQASKPKQRTASAAPVSRSNQFFSSRNMNASQVRLPPDLAAFVKQSGLDPTQYALGVIEDIKAGRKPKEWLDPDYNRFG